MIRLLSYNIRRGGTGRESALEAVIRPCAPDIVVFQEATVPAVIDTLSARCDMPYWGAHPRLSLGFISRIPMEHFSGTSRGSRGMRFSSWRRAIWTFASSACI